MTGGHIRGVAGLGLALIIASGGLIGCGGQRELQEVETPPAAPAPEGPAKPEQVDDAKSKFEGVLGKLRNCGSSIDNGDTLGTWLGTLLQRNWAGAPGYVAGASWGGKPGDGGWGFHDGTPRGLKANGQAFGCMSSLGQSIFQLADLANNGAYRYGPIVQWLRQASRWAQRFGGRNGGTGYGFRGITGTIEPVDEE